MKIKIYKLLSSAKQGLFALALTMFSGITYSQATYTFNYTGGVQTMNLPAGTYDIKMWGGDGGNSSNSRAGIGGYSTGTLTLLSTTTLYIVVGGEGTYTGVGGLQPGGYNGGGSGYAAGTGRAGGGATHIATVTGVLSALASSTSAVIIVAGGGGGDQNAGLIGHGGGLSGGGTYPGTQTGSSGGIFGSFGQGGDITTSYGGGGGGGWYGGGGNQNNAGSGGSGYIGGVTNGVTTMSAQPGFVTKPVVTGNGMVLIKELCSISLTSSGSNSLAPVICSGTTLTLTTNAASNYTWSNGNTTSTTITVSPTSTTTYSVIGTSTANCVTSAFITVTVSSGLPTLTVTNSSSPGFSVCLGKIATLGATGAFTYTWSNSVTNNVGFAPGATNTYTVSGQNGCGISQATTAISVAPLPVSAVTNPTITCTNVPAILSATVAANSFTWKPMNTVTSIPSLVVNPSVTTVYTLTASDGTCSGIAIITLAAKPIPTITSSASFSMYCSTPLTLTASGGDSYTWTPGGTVASSIVVNPTSPTLYQVAGSNSVGCQNTSNQVVVIGSTPPLGIGASNLGICAGETTTLNGSGATSYSWTNGPVATTYTVAPLQTEVYTVTASDPAYGCEATNTISIEVFAPSLTVSGNSVICDGQTATLTASGAGNYNWTPGGSLFPTQQVMPSANTTYTVTGTAVSTSGSGISCAVEGTIAVTVNPNPTITVTIPAQVCKNETAMLTANGASTYIWNATSGVISTSSSASVTPTSATIFIYTVTATGANSCNSSTVISLNVNSCNGIKEESNTGFSLLQVYPNPNNGEFVIKAGTAMELKIVNELGQLVRSIQLNETNDFKASVSGLSNGIYFVAGKGVNNKIVIAE